MNLLAHRQNDARIEDMKYENRHAKIGTGLKSDTSSEQKKNGIFEEIQDFGAGNEDGYPQRQDPQIKSQNKSKI